MTLRTDLDVKVAEIFRSRWEKRDGRVVPSPEDIKLGNDAVEFDRATVLYADLSGSTNLVDTMGWDYAAEVYKTFLHCAATLIRNEGGSITSYDGDRVMGIWVGDTQSTPAARCALKINYAVQNIINPALKAQYPTKPYVVQQTVGIDTSPLRAARTGVRGGNDIVWVGRAANYAAKLTEIKSDKHTWITKDVYDKLHNEAKFSSNGDRAMWGSYTWNDFGNRSIYGSSWTWTI